MKIVIVGAGALGGLLAALLSKGGQQVICLDPDQKVVTAINQRGIGMSSRDDPGQQLHYYPAQALTDPNQIKGANLLFLTTKSYHSKIASQQIAHLVGQDSPLITLQNGLGYLATITKSCDPRHVISGFTTLAATALGPGEISNDGLGAIYLGRHQQGDQTKLQQISAILKGCGLEAKEVTDIISRRWQRALVHGAINPVSALLRCRNQQLLDSIHTISPKTPH